MKFEERLYDKIGRQSGFTVPDGYFSRVAEEIDAKLPEIQQPVRQKLSTWHKVRPYVYLAAMFAGIWCMMQVFHRVSSPATLDLENPPELVAQAIGDPQSDPLQLDGLTLGSVDDDFIAEQEIMESYTGIDELVEDFGYELDPKYNNIEIPSDHDNKKL